MPDNDDDVRRLRGEVHRLRDDVAHLEQRLGYAWQQVEELRTHLLEGKRRLPVAEPVDRQRGAAVGLVPLAPAELEAAVVRLREIRPLPFATG